MWTWLDGKKTIIAGCVLLLSTFCSQVLIGIWGLEWWWLPNTILTLDWIGGLSFLGGLSHKGIKARSGV